MMAGYASLPDDDSPSDAGDAEFQGQDAGVGQGSTQSSDGSSYGQLLLAILPAEIVSAYLVINPLVPNPAVNFVFLLAGLLLTVLFAFGVYWKKPLAKDISGRPLGRPVMYTHVILAAIAFPLWAWVLGAPGLQLLPHWLPAGSLHDVGLRSASIALFTILLAPGALMVAGQPWKAENRELADEHWQASSQ